MAEFASSRPRDWRTPAALFASVALFYLLGLGLRPFVAPDEYRYAEIPREMLESGNWVVPQLDGVVYLEKPPMDYWLTAGVMRVLGENATSVRLPAAVSALLSAAILFALVWRDDLGRRSAYTATACFLTSIGVAATGTTAILDSPFALGVAATLAAFFVASEHPPGMRRQGWLALSGVACGIAFLTKGFLACVFPIVVVVPYLLWSGRSRDLFRLPWTPIVFAVATVAPWGLAITASEPDFWRYFVMQEHLNRFAGGGDAQHPEPFWFYIPVLLVGLLPWTFLFASGARHLPKLSRTPLMRFAICWIAGVLLLLSASSGKLPTYPLPCFVPLFIVFAYTLDSIESVRLGVLLDRVSIGIGACAVVAAIGLLALSGTAPLQNFIGPGEEWRVIAAAIGLSLLGVIGIGMSRSSFVLGKIEGIGATTLLIGVLVSVVFPTGWAPKTPDRFFAASLDSAPKNAMIFVERVFVQSASWHLRIDDIFVVSGAGELAYGMERPDQQGRHLWWAELEDLIRDPARTRTVALISRTGRSQLTAGLRPSRRVVWMGATYEEFAPIGAQGETARSMDDVRPAPITPGVG